MKCFTFAEIRQCEMPLEELMRREGELRYSKAPSSDEIKSWADGMRESLAPFEIGDIVIYLDGQYFSVEEKNVRFNGFFATHDLPALPHAQALDDAGILRRKLGDKAYWIDRERPRDEQL